MNPVIGRELTERMRGLRAFVALSIFVLLLTLTAFLVFEGSQAGQSSFDLAERTRAGRLVFESVVLVMTVLVLFFVPGVAAGAIAGERERQTLATLQVTLLRPRSIIAGKIVAALAYLVLLVVASLPVLAAAYVLGGIRVTDIVRGRARRVGRRLLRRHDRRGGVDVRPPRADGHGAGLRGHRSPRRARAAGRRHRRHPRRPHRERPRRRGRAAGGAAHHDTARPRVRRRAGVGDNGPLSGLNDGILEVKDANDERWFALFPDTPPRRAGTTRGDRIPGHPSGYSRGRR